MRNKLNVQNRQEEKTIKIVLNYLSNLHYRNSLFKKLQQVPNLEFNFIFGDVSPIDVKSGDLPEASYVKNLFLGKKSKIVWQSRMAERTIAYNPDVVIMMGVNPLITSSLVDFVKYKRKGFKIFWWGHGTLGNQGKLGRLFRIYFYKRADGVLVYDNNGVKRLTDEGVDKAKIFAIGNCLNFDDYGFNKYDISHKKRDVQKINLLFSGRLLKNKKLDVLLSALAKLGNTIDCHLTIVGDGGYRKSLEGIVKEYQIEAKVNFVGAKYGKDADKYFLNADVLVYPGSIGLAIIHAFSYGLPVITHSNEQIQKPEYELMKPGETGEVFEPENVHSLVDAILRAKDKIEKNKYSEECIRVVKTHATPEVVTNKIFKAILEKSL